MHVTPDEILAKFRTLFPGAGTPKRCWEWKPGIWKIVCPYTVIVFFKEDDEFYSK